MPDMRSFLAHRLVDAGEVADVMPSRVTLTDAAKLEGMKREQYRASLWDRGIWPIHDGGKLWIPVEALSERAQAILRRREELQRKHGRFVDTDPPESA